ncbi:unnamed protein product, partial [Amoebophrya sp. A25]
GRSSSVRSVRARSASGSKRSASATSQDTLSSSEESQRSKSVKVRGDKRGRR